MIERVLPLGAYSTVECVRMRARPRVFVHGTSVAVLRDYRILRLTVVLMLPFVVPLRFGAPGKSYDCLRITQIPILLFPRVARVQVALKVLRVTHETVTVLLFVR